MKNIVLLESTQKVLNILMILVTFFGVSLLVFLFFFLIPSENRTYVAVMNFITLIWLELLIFGSFRILSLQTKTKKNLHITFISGLIILFYSAAAAGIILLSFLNIGFKALVASQLILLFIFFVVEVILVISSKVSHEVVHEENVKKEGINTIREEMNILQLKINQLPNEFLSTKDLFAQIKEDISFTSPNGKPTAQKYEQEMLICINEIKTLFTEINYSQPASNLEIFYKNFVDKANQLKNLVTLRKQLLT